MTEETDKFAVLVTEDAKLLKTAEAGRIHPTDMALIETAKTGEGAVPITKEMLESIAARAKAEQDMLDGVDLAVQEIDYKHRLLVTAWVFKHICAHAREGGTFRHLIYGRLGFGPDAYVPLLLAGGMEISNHFDLPGEKKP